MLESTLFRSRWLLAPFYVGVALGIVALLWEFTQGVWRCLPRRSAKVSTPSSFRSYRLVDLTAKEVNPVLKALSGSGIEVTALHNHMLADQPRLFFMHFWANDDANRLANGLQMALGYVNTAS